MITFFFKKFQRVTQKGVSFLNGAVGDTLQDTPLDVGMNFYYQDKVVRLNALKKSYPTLSPKICVLIHGLIHNETHWNFGNNIDYGSLLQEDLGYTPFYLRYNTGLHISENGKKLACLLEELKQNYPVPIQEICLIAHSMGGLLTHSACHYGQEMRLSWTQSLRHIFLLATPHLGSYLEKFINLTTNVLEKVPNWITNIVGKTINLRSAGIKDLRFGYFREEDWKSTPPNELFRNDKTSAEKIKGVHYYVISGRLTQSEENWFSQLFGDILVNSKSALALSGDKHDFHFDLNNYHEFAKTNHFKLLVMPEVYERIKTWIMETA